MAQGGFGATRGARPRPRGARSCLLVRRWPFGGWRTRQRCHAVGRGCVRPFAARGRPGRGAAAVELTRPPPLRQRRHRGALVCPCVLEWRLAATLPAAPRGGCLSAAWPGCGTAHGTAPARPSSSTDRCTRASPSSRAICACVGGVLRARAGGVCAAALLASAAGGAADSPPSVCLGRARHSPSRSSPGGGHFCIVSWARGSRLVRLCHPPCVPAVGARPLPAAASAPVWPGDPALRIGVFPARSAPRRAAPAGRRPPAADGWRR